MFCRLFRFMISSAADSGSVLDRWTTRHVARCASCSQFARDCRTIDARLRSEAAGRQLCSERLSGVQMTGHGYRIRPPLAAAACLAIAAAVIFSLTMPARQRNLSTPTMTAAIPTSASWAMPWGKLIKNPLAAEAENLTSETESGIRFLVACLDVRPLGARMPQQPGEPGASPR